MVKQHTINSLLEKAVSEFKEDVAVISQENQNYKNYSYREIYEQIKKTASFFKKVGLEEGSHCLLLLENRLEWLISYFALICNGAICVPLNPDLRVNEILNLAKDCQAKKIISSQKIYQDKLKKDRDSLPEMIIVDAEKNEKEVISFSQAFDFSPKDVSEKIDPDQVASLIYTSGTTGSPKGVLLTHRNLASNLESIKKLRIIKRSDNVLAFLPLYHAYPFMVTLLAPFMLGAKITYFPVSFRKEVFLKVIKDTKITLLVAIPQFYQKLYAGVSEKLSAIPKVIRFLLFPVLRLKVKRNLGQSLRLLVSGGARLDREVGRGFQRLGFNLVEGYGLTETSPIATFNRPGKVKFGSVGTAVPGVDLRIDQPNQSGVGEICIKGSNVMKGYFKRPDLTDEVIKDDWFYTGDLGYIDREGYLFITGRKKEVIVLSSGKNIYPQDVEAAYLESPYIKEICVMSGQKEDQGAEFLFAVVVPDMEYCRRKEEADIKGKIRWQIEEISINLPIYQRIRNFAITQEELPKTALGKLQRHKIKEEHLDKSKSVREKKRSKVEDDPDITDKEKAKSIINTLSKILKKDVSINDHLELDLEIDSLGRVELATEIEAKFSLQLPDDFFLKVSTVKELILEILSYREKEVDQGSTAGDWKKILEKDPPEQIKRNLKVKTTFFDILITYPMKISLSFFFKLFLQLKVKGRQNIPSEKPFIIFANHTTYFDGFLLFAANFFKYSTETFFIGYRDIFELPAFAWAIRLARLIPIDATTRLLDSMRVASYVLDSKKILCLFPEGERAAQGKMREFKKGIGILLSELDIEALPVYIEGAFESWPRGQFLPRPHPVTVHFGEPVNAKKLVVKYKVESKNEYARISQALRLELEEIKDKVKNQKQ